MNNEQQQGEPVAMPARMLTRCYDALTVLYPGYVMWNACLDEIAKLGPLYTHADAGEVERLIAECWAACGGNGPTTREGLLLALKLMDEADDVQSSEVERLRAENKDYKEGQERYEQLCAELRDQLAGLRKAAGAVMDGFIEGAQVHPCDDQNEAVKVSTLSPVFQALYAALSASAEPEVKP